MSARFSQSHGIVPVVQSTTGDYNAGFSGETINMSKYNHCTLIIMGDTAAAGTGVLTIMAGAADEAETAAVTFTYRYISVDVGAVGADILSAPATSAALGMVEANLKDGMYVIEWDAQDMNVANVTYDFATPVVDATGTAGYVTMVAILSEPRYAKNIMPTAIPIA